MFNLNLNLNLKRVLAASLCAVFVLTLASCDTGTTSTDPDVAVSNEDIVLTIGGEPMNYEEYRYFFMNTKTYTSGGDDAYWTDNEGAIDKLKEDTIYSIAQFRAIEMLAAENSIELSDEDLANTDATIESYISMYGEEEFNNLLTQDFLTVDLFKKINNTLLLDSYLYDTLASSGALATDEEAVKADIRENYVRAMHILYADQATAEGILEEAQTCTDEEFYELAQPAEDPGMVGNTEGYTFTYGQMVEPFEKATYELEVGETSGLVKSDFGYHIIRRLDLTDEYIDEHYDELAANKLMEAYYNYVDEYANELSAGIEYEAVYDSLNIDTVK